MHLEDNGVRDFILKRQTKCCNPLRGFDARLRWFTLDGNRFIVANIRLTRPRSLQNIIATVGQSTASSEMLPILFFSSATSCSNVAVPYDAAVHFKYCSH